MNEETRMVEVDGARPTTAERHAMWRESHAIVDRADRVALVSHSIGLVLVWLLWIAAVFAAKSDIGDAALLVLLAREVVPRLTARRVPGLLEVRDQLARERGFVIPGRTRKART
jgi:hypothetical protein